MHGRAELHLEEQKVVLEPGDSWVVPQGALHTYTGFAQKIRSEI
jgi:mannose-6-phosphate isomerase-like protein (cupin superfamily)